MLGRLRLSRQTVTDMFHYLLPGRAHARAVNHMAGCEPELALLPALVDRRREAIDVGANIGLYTAALAGLATRVIAIEAHPRLARVLSGVPAHNVEIIRRAASDRAGETVQLTVSRQGSRELDGYGHLSTGAAASSDKLYAVDTMTLDELADRPVGFVKIDVEGHELAVLAGAVRLVERQQPVFLVEAELRHRHNAPYEVFRFFAERGYTGLFLHDDALAPVETFSAGMQDIAVLTDARLGNSADYINNFLFLPPGFDIEALQARLPALLIGP